MYFTIIIIKECPHERSSSMDWPAFMLMNAQAVCCVVWSLWPCPVGSCWPGCVLASQQHVRSWFLPKFKLTALFCNSTHFLEGRCPWNPWMRLVWKWWHPTYNDQRARWENGHPWRREGFNQSMEGHVQWGVGRVHPAWPLPLRQALFFRKLRLSSCTVLSREASIEAPCKFLLRKYGSLCFKSLLAAQQPLMFNLVPCMDLSLWGCPLGESTLPHPCTRPISHCKLISWCFWLLNQPLVGWENHESVPWAWAVPNNQDTAAPRAPLNCDCRAGLSTPGNGMWPVPQRPPTNTARLTLQPSGTLMVDCSVPFGKLIDQIMCA